MQSKTDYSGEDRSRISTAAQANAALDSLLMFPHELENNTGNRRKHSTGQQRNVKRITRRVVRGTVVGGLAAATIL